ncbi:hypothetical protein J3R30DRAFT_3699343 [Lentinula aciculospora]|uniref:Uncharacterized protein n=1 Tax=Lentinula aciculospora TaxID=153920 RepID=A0A9W9AHM1_9AGAR|nr:hypothetical protein J3R30DRAFT_3699343 [Lentinula aciculospora]
MKFVVSTTVLQNVFITLLAFTQTVLAQNVIVGLPTDESTVPAGSNLTVRIDRPDTLSGSTEVALVMGISPCGSLPCPGPSNILGTILYNGPFNPQFSIPSNSLPPHENFTVSIPEGFVKGRTQFGVLHVSLIGAGLAPFLETLNTTLMIV